MWPSFLSHLLNRVTQDDFGNQLLLNKPSSEHFQTLTAELSCCCNREILSMDLKHKSQFEMSLFHVKNTAYLLLSQQLLRAKPPTM